MACNDAEFMKTETALSLAEITSDSRLSVARIEIAKGAVTQAHRHESECLMVVLEGVWRFHVRGRAITVQQGEMLRMPPAVEHSAEAVADTVALTVSTMPGSWSGCGPFLQCDPDQYLWGV
jgi:quercetin dioxygenase-like cupin family protein